ncbi:MAG: hypothetical protein U0232_04675 [Thermomicrobiales bacterium]
MGLTLALAYAQAHPERVASIVLGFVTTTSRREVGGSRRGGADFSRASGSGLRRRCWSGCGICRWWTLMELLADPDPAVRERAAREWVQLGGCARFADAGASAESAPRGDPEFRLRFARLVTHYRRAPRAPGEEC